ncbi:MAG TPA: DUF4440 domain-containing protein [Gemmatimonadaceae bacterium]|nr:DUF4440 domain-containing protein [Gemmatimonadaceae bacterium]
MRHLILATVAFVAACAPTEAAPDAAPEAPAPLDSAAARAIVENELKPYSDRLVAGDAAGLAALFADDATVDFLGSPSTTGRPNIQALVAAAMPTTKLSSEDFSVGAVNGDVPGMITSIGTNRETFDSAGVTLVRYGRWAAALRQQGDGAWRWSYVMWFPDSTGRSRR